MSDVDTPVARWLPPAVLDAPDQDGAPRLLEALLAGVERQRVALAADIDRLWDDFFVESCAEWAIPYIAELVGLGPGAGRVEVAYAVALRRRKGTAAALEDFVRVVTGWHARAVEGWRITTWAQQLDHPGPPRPAAADFGTIRRARLGTPFEQAVRSVTPGGAWSPRAVTAVVWPWQVRTYVRTSAASLGSGRYALHPLGQDAPLHVRPDVRPLASDVSSVDAVPRRRAELETPSRAMYELVAALAGPGDLTYGTDGRWSLGPDHPLVAPTSGEGQTWPRLLELTADGKPIPWSAIRLASVPATGTIGSPAAGEVLVDLARGHVLPGSDYSGTLRATWHRPVSGAIGALAVDARADLGALVVVTVDPAQKAAGTRVQTLKDAIDLAQTLSKALDPSNSRPGRPDVEIRLSTSDELAAPPPQKFTPRLPNWRIVGPSLTTPRIKGALSLDLAGASLTLEGFLLADDLVLGPGLASVVLRALTMNPSGGASLTVDDGAWTLELEARQCVLAPIRADLTATAIGLTDCIVDGVGQGLRVCGGSAPGSSRAAIDKNKRFAPALRANGVTFAGRVHAEALDAVDCVFVDGVDVVQQQEGCLRHCYLGPPEASPSHPLTYRCRTSPPPTFVSRAFEAGGYFALELRDDEPLLSAASDGGEVGAYHHARRGQSLQRLEQRAHEFVPIGLHARVALAPWEES